MARDLAKHYLQQRFLLQESSDIDFSLYAKKAKTLIGLDTKIRSKMLGFEGAHTCWRAVSCVTAIPDIEVPLLAIVARDDPITKFIHYPLDDLLRNKNIMVAITNKGGHSDFFYKAKKKGKLYNNFERMAPQMCVEYFAAVR